MTAASIMTKEVLTIRDSGTMLDAFRLLKEKKVRQIPVLDGQNRVIGVITPRALMKAILPRYVSDGLVADVKFAPELPDFVKNIDSLARKKVSDLMERDFVTVGPETSTMEVAALLVNPEKHADSVVVVDDMNRLLGIISPWDVFRRLWDYSEKKKKE
ncbi:MAG: CBS domain-containing protein [Deltaproteobacteria bacterium]|nr:CBS domain-containing protein [Deltaproteobacteria bacterium]MBZ0219455.1 CBS domain-containing protein [Deltaproteobacteria bacterium]